MRSTKREPPPSKQIGHFRVHAQCVPPSNVEGNRTVQAWPTSAALSETGPTLEGGRAASAADRTANRNADRMKRPTCFDGGCSLTAPVCCGCAHAAHGISSLRRTGNNNAALNIHAEANAFEGSADLHMSARGPSDKKPPPRQGNSQLMRERRASCGFLRRGSARVPRNLSLIPKNTNSARAFKDALWLVLVALPQKCATLS